MEIKLLRVILYETKKDKIWNTSLRIELSGSNKKWHSKEQITEVWTWDEDKRMRG